MKYKPIWQKCRDAVAGEDEVKLNGEIYLPKPSGMTDEDYSAYKVRAQFFNATGRTLDGFAGMINRKPPIVTVPKGMENYLNNVDGNGHTLAQFIDMVCRDVLTTNWGSILVDMPSTDSVKSQADKDNSGLYPYMAYYKAEASINFYYETVGRFNQLKYVILKEPTITRKPGAYTTEVKDYYRVLEIDENGKYRQTLYNDRCEIVKSVNPRTKKGEFDYIPFSFMSSKNEPDKPIMLDLVNVNFSHYRKSADHENGLHWTGVPTPFERGWMPEDKYNEKTGQLEAADPIKLGGTQFLCFPPGTEQVSYLEFSGSGLTQISNAMRED